MTPAALIAAHQPLRLFGVTMMGATPENGRKLLLSIAFVLVAVYGGQAIRWLALKVAPKTIAFWTRQAISLLSAAVLLIGLASIWFDDPSRLATVLGMVTAGVAFALQRVITAVAGYFVILRGSTFNVGDRIMMGGVRGDVISLSFMQTTILEMGEPPGEQADAPAMWVRSRQYTGRIVTVTNAKIFDDPVYNYSRDLPYVWEEMSIPVRYSDDRARAERIVLDAALKHTAEVREMAPETIEALRKRYDLPNLSVEPRVYWRLTDNWVEMSVRFLSRDHGTRELKDAMSRDILAGFDAAGLQIASGTYEIIGAPTIRVETAPPRA